MDNEVVREDSDSTQRRAWTAAEATAHPALGLGQTDSLSRQPLGSQSPVPAQLASSRSPRPSSPPALPRSSRPSSPPSSPQSASSSETVVTPAPQFDRSGGRIDASDLVVATEPEDELDGIVELSSAMLVEDGESSEIEMLADDLIEEDDSVDIEAEDVLEAADVLEEEVLEEVDSELLSFVEARGEIIDKPQRAPSPVEVSSVSLSALHETLHNQAVDSGMATYSTGVPIHSLDRESNTGKTFQIQRPVAATSNSNIRNILMATVLFAGIGTGVYFGLPSSPSSAAPTSAAPAKAAAAVIIPADASQNQLAAVDEQANAPVVAPLVEITEDPQIGDEAALDATDTGEVALQAGVPVVKSLADDSEQPVAQAAVLANNIDVRPLEVEPEVAPPTPEPEVSAPSKSAARKTSPRIRTVARDSGASKASPKGDPGVLMLGAKPPCDILIDGKKTGLKTPQRVLSLPPGKHRITLVNQEHKLRESFRVSIQSGKTTRVVRDLTSKL